MRDGLSGPNHPRRNLSELAGLLKTALFLTDMRAGPHTSRAPGVSAPRGRAPRHWAGEPGPRRRGKSGSPPLPPRERRFRPRWGGAARAPRPRPPRGPAPKSARFPRPACSPRASLPVSGSASPGPDSVTRTASKTVCQRRPGGNGSRTPPLAIRPRGERQGARSPGGETRSPARAGAPPSLPAPSHLTAGSTVHSPGASPRLQVPASRAGHVRPAVARPAPGEEPAGSRPLGPRPGARSLPGASPAGPRPAPALRRAGPSRRLTRPARLSFQSGRGAARSAARAVRPVSATPQPGPKEPGRPVDPRGAGEGGAPLFPFPERGLHFFALSFLTLSYPRRRKPGSLPFAPGRGPSGVTPHRAGRGGLGCREAPLPLRASPRLETWEGGPGRLADSCALGWGVTSTFSRRTECPRAQCFRSGIPALGPAAARRDRECPVPAGKLRAGPAGLPGPLPCQSRLPGGWRRGAGGGRS